jgi:hypothetical protein
MGATLRRGRTRRLDRGAANGSISPFCPILLRRHLPVEQMRASEWRFTAHLNMVDCHIINHRCVDFPRLIMSDCSPRGRRSKATAGRTFFVGSAEFDNLADAVEALNAPEE